MNDFTKEELESLALCIFHSNWVYKADKKTIIDKFIFLIDNYDKPKECEHLKILKGAYPRSNPPKKCETCGVLYYE